MQALQVAILGIRPLAPQMTGDRRWNRIRSRVARSLDDLRYEGALVIERLPMEAYEFEHQQAQVAASDSI
jgi:hypothetical protein